MIQPIPLHLKAPLRILTGNSLMATEMELQVMISPFHSKQLKSMIPASVRQIAPALAIPVHARAIPHVHARPIPAITAHACIWAVRYTGFNFMVMNGIRSFLTYL